MVEILFSVSLNSDTSIINSVFNQPLELDQQHYKYYVKLLNVSFSNVFSNVTEKLYVNGLLMANTGIYEITDLVSAYNETVGATCGEMGLNINTGLLWIKNDQATDITITTSNFLSSDLGGNFNLPITLHPDEIVYSTTVPIIQSYNYFILTSQNIHNNAYINSVNPEIMRLSNMLYQFSSAMKAFQFKTWTAIEDISFELNQTLLSKIDFELRTGNDESLENLIIGNTDFNVHLQIIRIPKV